MITFINNQGSFTTWAHITNDKLTWSQLVNNLGNKGSAFDYNKSQKKKRDPQVRLIQKNPLNIHHLRLHHLHLFIQVIATRNFSRFSNHQLLMYREKLLLHTKNWLDCIIPTNGIKIKLYKNLKAGITLKS